MFSSKHAHARHRMRCRPITAVPFSVTQPCLPVSSFDSLRKARVPLYFNTILSRDSNLRICLQRVRGYSFLLPSFLSLFLPFCFSRTKRYPEIIYCRSIARQSLDILSRVHFSSSIHSLRGNSIENGTRTWFTLADSGMLAIFFGNSLDDAASGSMETIVY